MSDLVPLACSVRQVVDFDRYAEFIGEELQRVFPQTHARAVAATSVGGDNKARGTGIADVPDFLAPAADGVHREGRRIIVDTDAHPASVGGEIVDAVRNSTSELFDQNVMHAHLFRFGLRPPLAASVLEVADEFPFLRVNRDLRLVLGQCYLELRIDQVELLIAV